MRRCTGLIMILAAVLLFVSAGCSSGSAYKDYPTYSHLNIDGYLVNEHYGNDAEFRKLYERVQEEEYPAKAQVTAPDLECETDDAELAAYLYTQFSRMAVKTEGQKVQGGEYSVTFTWNDGAQWTYVFHDDGENVFFMENESTGHRVSTPDTKFWPLIGIVRDYEKTGTWEPIPQPDPELSSSVADAGFDWDCDGDGTQEHFTLEYYEHRDGLSSDLSIYMKKDGVTYYVGTEVSSDLTDREEGVDEEGPWIRFHYLYRYPMEEYTMEDQMVLELRFTGEELVLSTELS